MNINKGDELSFNDKASCLYFGVDPDENCQNNMNMAFTRKSHDAIDDEIEFTYNP